MTELIKRRLPTWMQSNDASKNEKIGTLDRLCSTSGNQTEMEGAVSMTESMSSEAEMVLAEKIKNSGNKQIFAKSCSKKNTRKPKNSDGSKDSACDNTGGAKRKSKGEILELTVKDLINIAEEFLTANKEMIQKEQSAARKCESDLIFMSSSESAIAGNLNREIKTCQPLTQSSKLNNLVQEQAEESAKSVDAAQEMLQLFLGPLLKKPPLMAPDKEMAAELLSSTYESDGFVGVEERAPLMKKKKSSFKDKVAMFF